MFDFILSQLNARNDRSAWDKGVTLYALDLLEALEDRLPADHIPETSKELEGYLLNGAASWQQYSYSGCALVYDGDIAAVLCTPSELKRIRNGERRPNRREEWLDVQARALYQAAARIRRAWRAYMQIVEGGK